MEFVNHTWLSWHSIANQHKLLVKVSQEWCLLQLSPRSSWSTTSQTPQSILLSTLLPKLPQQPIKLWTVDEISNPKLQNPPEPSSKMVQTSKKATWSGSLWPHSYLSGTNFCFSLISIAMTNTIIKSNLKGRKISFKFTLPGHSPSVREIQRKLGVILLTCSCLASLSHLGPPA